MTFDGPSKLIILQPDDGLSLSVRHLWSRWADWVALGDNSKYPYAFEQMGGQEIDPGAGTLIPIYIFLKNGWRVRPKEASHTLTVGDGILLVDGGGDPFVNTLGSFTVRVNYQQPVQAISFATSNATTPADVADAVWSTPAGSTTMGATLSGLVDNIFDVDRVGPSISLKDALRLLLAVTTCKASGGGTTNVVFRNLEDTQAAVSMVVDVNGNRTAVSLNP